MTGNKDQNVGGTEEMLWSSVGADKSRMKLKRWPDNESGKADFSGLRKVFKLKVNRRGCDLVKRCVSALWVYTGRHRLMAKENCDVEVNNELCTINQTETSSKMVLLENSKNNENGLDTCYDGSSCHQPSSLADPSIENDQIFNALCTSPIQNSLTPVYGPQRFTAFESCETKEFEPVQGVCGLRNLGNTCFMNAGLQCLLNNVNLIQFFLNNDCLSADKNSLSGAFTELMNMVWSGSYSVLYPAHLKKILGERYPQFKDFRQHDCQEFLALLLDTFHEQLNTGPDTKKAANHTSVDKCDDCEKSSEIVYLSMNDTHCLPSNQDIVNQTASSSTSMLNSHCTNQSQASSGNSDSCGNINVKCKLSPELQTSYRLSENKIDSIKKSEDSENVSEAINSFNDDLCSNYKNILCKETTLKPEKNELANIDKISPNKFSVLDDFIKDTKTLNTNVLVEVANNELAVDSEKFPKLDRIGHQGTLDNLHSLPVNVIHNSKEFKLKETNLSANNGLKKNVNVKSNNSLGSICKQVGSALGNECSVSNIKRTRLEEISDNRMHCKKIKRGCNLLTSNNLSNEHISEDDEDTTVDSSDQSDEDIASEPQQEMKTDMHDVYNALAEKEWNKYLEQNDSVMVSTFQGQFKSTVVCSVCNHLSVTFEPFMYLPVPLPHAMDRQFSIIYVYSECQPPKKYLVTIMRNMKVADLKKSFLSILKSDNKPEAEILLAEVYERRISKILDDSMLLQYINDDNRLLYAYKMSNHNTAKMDVQNESGAKANSDSQDNNTFNKWQSCAICLEEMLDTELLCHPLCGCILCESCIKVGISLKHYGGTTLTCPVCSKILTPEIDFVPLLYQVNEEASQTRDSTKEFTDCRASQQIFGHPLLLKIPAKLPISQLYDILLSHCKLDVDFKLLYVDSQGLRCSRCDYTANCSGCEVNCDEEVVLHPGDNLCVEFYQITEEQKQTLSLVENHCSVESQRKSDSITLYHCLEAFGESESLDELNPWFCSECCKNQSAVKTLTVWRYPDTIMVYLKRFVFHDQVSTKLDNQVIFPVHDDLELGEFVSGPSHFNNMDSSNLYTLQSCVSHFGGMNSGHYTGYSKHAVTGEWYYFNDETVVKKEPQDEDRRNAYILFYQKKGIALIDLPEKISLPKDELGSNCSLMEITSSHCMKPDAVDKVLMVLESDEKEEQEKQLQAL
ncbi:Ubiquitin carboxyl-terminal hydrolase 4 [Nymphon striatum]|nr:Ubiquitin carboxyl-terminal hydrolase 4 [Nymphon striatum]